MSRSIWIDVEDLFDYVKHSARPSGIQRLAYEIYREMRAARGDSVRFLRHAENRNSFVLVGWEEISALFESLTGSTLSVRLGRREAESVDIDRMRPVVSADATPRMLRLLRPLYLPIVSRLPESVRAPLASFVWFQGRSFASLGACVEAILRWRAGRSGGMSGRLVETPRSAQNRAAQDEEMKSWRWEYAVQPGDVLLILGSPWFKAEYAALLHDFSASGGRVGVLIYDIIPLRRPEWCDQALVRRFADWFHSVLPRTDMLFAISQASARDIQCYAAGADLPITERITVVPIGSGFGKEQMSVAGDEAPASAGADRLPPAGSYVLFVSTIEARKNHVMMFRVWRKLLEALPAERVPVLVFAGRVGWLVADLMQQLRNTRCLDGKIMIIEDAGDAEVEALYRGCMFTVFPSLYEGWGLPVTESLRFGKPCIIADNTSMPEAGGDLARYFDADDLNQAFKVIRSTIENAPDLAAWQERVRRDFRVVPWRATADAIIAVLEEADVPPTLRTQVEDAPSPNELQCQSTRPSRSQEPEA